MHHTKYWFHTYVCHLTPTVYLKGYYNDDVLAQPTSQLTQKPISCLNGSLQMHFSSVFCVTWKSQDDDEEREDLGVGRPAVPQSPSPPSNRLEVRSLSLPDLDSAYISQHYMQMAQNILTSLLLPCPILSPHNVKLAEEHPIAAGGFANIWKATYAGGEVVLKSYRCYKSFNVTQVITVRWVTRSKCSVGNSLPEILQRDYCA